MLAQSMTEIEIAEERRSKKEDNSLFKYKRRMRHDV
jgi:hypothetical protein